MAESTPTTSPPEFVLNPAACSATVGEAAHANCAHEQYRAALQAGAVPSRAVQHARAVLDRIDMPRTRWSTATALIETCVANPAKRPQMNALRVPRTASTTFLHAMSHACNQSQARPFWLHNAPPSDSCTTLSTATIREPCGRFESTYRGLLGAYDWRRRDTACARAPGHCKAHWVHTANSVDEFVYVAATHWTEIMTGGEALSLSTRSPRPGFGKHAILAVPQAVYVGNYTWTICDLESELPPIFDGLGCRGEYDVDHLMADSTRKDPLNASKVQEASQWKLSTNGCRLVRQLYLQDTRLYESTCTGRSGYRHRSRSRSRSRSR